MSETRYSIERDLKETSAMANALTPYVHEDQLYGKVGGTGLFGMGQMPSLTIGALLLRLRRLSALSDQLTPEQRSALDTAITQHESVRREWSLHYTQKLAYEAKSRLKAMDTFFDEMRDDPRMAAQSYLPEAQRRTIAHEIVAALPEPDDEVTKAIKRADTALRRWTMPDSFLWDSVLEPVYPQSAYWWLYVRPAPPIKKHAD